MIVFSLFILSVTLVIGAIFREAYQILKLEFKVLKSHYDKNEMEIEHLKYQVAQLNTKLEEQERITHIRRHPRSN